MAQRNKGERKVLMTRAGMAGSSSRTGPDDPRHRRGAQAEMELEQRFDPDDFEVDDKQRVKVRKSGVAAQAVCLESETNSLAVANTWYSIGLSAPTTSVGTFITVNTASDHITLQGGHIYVVDADVNFRNSQNNATKRAYLKIRATDDTSYGERDVLIAASNDFHGGIRDPGASIYVSAVVDLSARGPLDIDIQVKGSHAEVEVRTGGWITVQRIG
jgi:hypothetical protein